MWKVHLRASGGTGETEKWFQIQDLIVEEIRKEMIFLGETVLQVSLHFTTAIYSFLKGRSSQIWERRSDVQKSGSAMDVDKT